MGLAPISPRNRRRLMIYAGITILFLASFHVLRQSERGSLITTGSLRSPFSTDEKGHQRDPCASLEGLEDVFVIVRTGSNEVRQKLPPLLNTTLPCFRHYGIWSDMQEEFAGHHIMDALDEIEPALLRHHSDFEYYRQLQEHGKETALSGDVAGWTDAPNTNLGRDTPAWKLDKWKFLPSAKKAYQQRPTSKWYVFIECDTYVFWTSLLAYLSSIDASRPYYIGRQMNIGKELFAYGGAGIIISNSAMGKLVEQYTADLKTYNQLTIDQWAGDFILSRAMSDAGVEFSQIWPTLEGEMPSTLNLKSKSTKGRHLWCYYAVSYHHMAPEDIYTYYDFDQAWISEGRGLPRHGDIFRRLVYPKIKEHISDWDNLSSDKQSENASFAECREICEKQHDCVQFSLAGRTCKTMNGAKLGRQKLQEKESDERVDSGWILDRVKSLMEDLEASCSGQDWIIP